MKISFPGTISTVSPYVTALESRSLFQPELKYDLVGNQLRLHANGHVLTRTDSAHLRFSDSEPVTHDNELTQLGKRLVEQLRAHEAIKTIGIYTDRDEEILVLGLITPIPQPIKIYNIVQQAAQIIKSVYTPRGIPDKSPGY